MNRSSCLSTLIFTYLNAFSIGQYQSMQITSDTLQNIMITYDYY